MKMPDIFREAEEAVFGRHHHAADAAHQPPATVPATMAAAPAPARTKENRMSLITDVENGYAAVKAEVAKLEQNLPAALGVAKKLEGNPLVQVAIKGAEHVAAGLIPPEALAYLASQFGPALDGLLALYNPAQGTQAAPVQPQQGAPAQG